MSPLWGTGPSGVLNIGDPIAGGTANSILYIDSSGNIAEKNPEFTFDDSSSTFNIEITGTGFGAAQTGITITPQSNEYGPDSIVHHKVYTSALEPLLIKSGKDDDSTFSQLSLGSDGLYSITDHNGAILDYTGSVIRHSVNTLFPDNVKVLFGTGSDSSIYYDGTDTILDQEVGSGSYRIKNGHVIITEGKRLYFNGG